MRWCPLLAGGRDPLMMGLVQFMYSVCLCEHSVLKENLTNTLKMRRPRTVPHVEGVHQTWHGSQCRSSGTLNRATPQVEETGFGTMSENFLGK